MKESITIIAMFMAISFAMAYALECKPSVKVLMGLIIATNTLSVSGGDIDTYNREKNYNYAFNPWCGYCSINTKLVIIVH